MRRVGCFIAIAFTLTLVGAGLVVWLIASALDAVLGSSVAILGAIALILAVALFLRGFGRLAGPVDELSEAAARVAAGDLAARVEPASRGPRAIRELVAAFNTMAERLELDEARRRSLLADVSHELRTPLAVIAGNVEAMLDGIHPADPEHLGILLDETRTLERLVEDLRTLALAEAGTLSLHREPTDVDVLLAEVGAGFDVAAASAGIELRIDVPDDLPIVDLDAVRIREVVSNLLANALRHTPAGGTIMVAGSAGPDGLEIVVSDTGSGIEPEVLPHLFERFAKGAGSRGSGLGLAIARSIVEAHGGTITAESPPGTGAALRVRLPVGRS
jgi:two-component system sensor histidine kinase BaeS